MEFFMLDVEKVNRECSRSASVSFFSPRHGRLVSRILKAPNVSSSPSYDDTRQTFLNKLGIYFAV